MKKLGFARVTFGFYKNIALAFWITWNVAVPCHTAYADRQRTAIPSSPPHPSIHARELRFWNAHPERNWKQAGLKATSPRFPARPAAHVHEILGFHPYWMGNRYLAYDWSILSTVVFFSLELNAQGALTNLHGWPWNDLVTRAHNGGARILVAASLFSTVELDTLLSNPTHRANAIANLVNAVLAGNADGVCIDFEQIPGSRKQQFVLFADELQTALRTTLPNSKIVIITPAVDWNNAYDFDELAARADYLMLMAYDYHWSGSATSGPVAPLQGWGSFNVEWSVFDHLFWGAPPKKLILGVPYYGYRWSTVDSLAASMTTSAGNSLIFSGIQDQYAADPIFDVASQTPWHRVQNGGWQQVWFDNAQSLALKYALVHRQALAGVGIWALGYDDPYTELWNTLHNAFDVSPVDATPVEPVRRGLQFAGANPFRHEIELALDPDQTDRQTRVAIYDARGHLVRILLPDASLLGGSAGSHVPMLFRWDGRQDNGGRSPAGIYFARARRTPPGHALRLVLLPPNR